MDIELQLPDPALMDSMRSVGYSLESAFADLIDNSLAANADDVRIIYQSVGSSPFVGILDNGRGMNPEEARIALKLAGTNPGQIRGVRDLGRFGLGLKTASLSQARSLTVITKQGETVTGLEWDLDFLAETGAWTMKVLDPIDRAELPLVDELEALQSGTLVLWRKLDLLLGDATNVSTYMSDQMARSARHIELVFHRFLNGEGAETPVTISMNGRPLKRIDPFLERHPSTQRSPLEVIGQGSAQITVQAFTLPHLSRMKPADRERARVGDRLRDSQGFYVYRNRRLIDWGSWFRLAPKDELAKLARVRVDIPNTLDGLWSLDIKKSRAVPPESVRRELKRLIDRIVGQSKRVHTYRGRQDDSQVAGEYVWELINLRDSFAYRINREHPLLMPTPGDSVLASERLETIYSLVEEMFPVNDLYARMGGDLEPQAEPFSDDFLISAGRAMWKMMGSAESGEYDRFATSLSQIEPFMQKPDVAAWLKSKEDEIVND